MSKKKVRFLVDQKTNFGDVMNGEEKLIPSDIAEIYVERGIAEYTVNFVPFDRNYKPPETEPENPPENVNVEPIVKDSEEKIPEWQKVLKTTKKKRRKSKNRFPISRTRNLKPSDEK